MAFATKVTSGPAADDDEPGITAGSDGGLTERRRSRQDAATVRAARQCKLPQCSAPGRRWV